MEYPHKPVLKQEVLEAFSGISLKRFIDGTLGLGGHAEALLSSHPEIVEYIGIDQDVSALTLAKERLSPFGDKLKCIHINFADALDTLLKTEEGKIDGILLDLGVSSMQLDMDERGFSFRNDGPLDMRMNKSAALTAEEIVNTYSQEDLGRIFREGEEKQWRKAASVIVKEREARAIKTTLALATLLANALKVKKPYTIHPATLIFQALRIAVNKELEVLTDALPKALRLLCKGGIMAIISFHSLEDRIVKQYFHKESLDKEGTSGLGGGLFLNREPTLLVKTRKPISASDEEIAENSRSRSAKLRVALKL